MESRLTARRAAVRFGIRLIVAATSIVSLSLGAGAADRYATERNAMVDDFIVAEGIRNERVIDVMRAVPRHEFVPRHLRRSAYKDAALPIGERQTISPPFIVAYMTSVLDPQPTDRILEIGTGSGYQAAVLSGLVSEVYTIEIVEELGTTAAQRLERLGYENVHPRVGDGYRGWPQQAPFDKIIVTCSPESIPDPLVDQLADGGQMLIPLGERYQQVFHLLIKRNGMLEKQRLIPTLFVPMTGISEQQREILPDTANPEVVNGGFEDDINQDGKPDSWHYQRQTHIDKDAAGGQRCVRFENTEPGRLSQALQGSAINGRVVQRVSLKAWVRTTRTQPGNEPHEVPAIMLHLYDADRQLIETCILGPLRGSSGWKYLSKTFDVPARAREMILRVGLNGGTGTLWVDDLELVTIRR